MVTFLQTESILQTAAYSGWLMFCSHPGGSATSMAKSKRIVSLVLLLPTTNLVTSKTFTVIFFFVLSTVQTQPSDFYYIGIKDMTGNNQDWRLDNSGDVATYLNWGSGEPNYGWQQCVTMVRYINGQWLDVPCNENHFFVCQRKGN